MPPKLKPMANYWKLKIDQGKWIITTRRRIWILSARAVVYLKTASVLIALLAVVYAAMLGLRVRRADSDIARIGAITNSYMNKNSREVERREQILLFSYNYFTKAIEADSRSRIRNLREPLPDVSEVEKQLGKADIREMDGTSGHLSWNQVIWQKPKDWPSQALQNQVWTSTKSKILEAWFDAHGLLTKMVLIRREPDGKIEIEIVGLLASDYLFQSFEQ
jgi:hypothetical protein